jgi:hypothetical protein
MGAVGETYRRASPGDFFHSDSVGKVPHGATAILLGDGNAQQPKIPHLAPKISRELIVVIDTRGSGRNFAGGKLVDGIPKQTQFFAVAVL